ncbi:hypothetical protein Golomagni_07528, partial [Golovinomyces magnicellulatus]
PQEAAEQHYSACLKYRYMIAGFGLDANEHDRPPKLFDDVFRRARANGFKVTAHCDVGVKNTHEHIRQVAYTVAEGLDRIDHGLNTADKAELIDIVKKRRLALTICPWAYLRRETYESIADRLKTLVDAGVIVCIGSDGPPYMDDCWVTHNLMLARQMGGFTNAQLVALMRNAVDASWASVKIKESLSIELEEYIQKNAEYS